VYLIVRFDLSPRIWLSPLMILGTQWYILFNVVAGATAFPSDFREAAERPASGGTLVPCRRRIAPGQSAPPSNKRIRLPASCGDV
jgi:ABC-type anion transport system duplicated permease subunit